jgi:CRP-like cAMP-binding protein
VGTHSVNNPWVRKLRLFADVSVEDERFLNDLVRNARTVPARQDIISQGDLSECLYVVVEGAACRYKMLPDGRRQIMAFLLPGDSCDVHTFLMKRMDHSIATLVPSRVAVIPRFAILEMTEQRPRLTRIFWWSTMVDEAILREWIVVVGRRTAYERVSHLLWEIYLRLAAIDSTSGSSCEVPFNQTDMADTLGLSLVHVNRSVRRLKQEGLISLEGRRLTILDRKRLPAAANFDPDYLHQVEMPVSRVAG